MLPNECKLHLWRAFFCKINASELVRLHRVNNICVIRYIVSNFISLFEHCMMVSLTVTELISIGNYEIATNIQTRH